MHSRGVQTRKCHLSFPRFLSVRIVCAIVVMASRRAAAVCWDAAARGLAVASARCLPVAGSTSGALAGTMQTRGIISVKVMHEDLDMAVRKLNRKMSDNKLQAQLKRRDIFTPPCEERRVMGKQAKYRLQGQEFARKLRWIMLRKDRRVLGLERGGGSVTGSPGISAGRLQTGTVAYLLDGNTCSWKLYARRILTGHPTVCRE